MADIDRLLTEIWNTDSPHINVAGYHAYPIGNKYVVLYASPDDPAHTPGSGIRLDISHVGVYDNLIAAAAHITNERIKDGR